MLIVMDKSTQAKILSHPLQTEKKQFEVAITFQTGYEVIFNFIITLIYFFDNIN